MVKIALVGITVYLAVILSLIGVKFIRTYHQTKAAEKVRIAAPAAPVAAPQPATEGKPVSK
jgi:hypothetical protein